MKESFREFQGGHNVPEETIRRRYFSGIKNLLKYYLPLADIALILDNSFDGGGQVVASKNMEYPLKIEDTATWKKIEKIAYE